MKTPVVRTVALLAAVGVNSNAVAQSQYSSLASCETCDAGGYRGYGYSYGDSYKQSYMQNTIWPKQYVWPARRGICQAFNTMAANGWRRHNALGPYHFRDDTSELTESGQLKAKWILTQAPVQRRTVYVQPGVDELATSERIQSIQEFAASLSPSAAPADVRQTHVRDLGRPAGAVDAIFTGFQDNQLPPVLPEPNTGASGSSP